MDGWMGSLEMNGGVSSEEVRWREVEGTCVSE
jgi:hypothetical protein